MEASKAEIDYKKATEALASRLIWALRYLKSPSGFVMPRNEDGSIERTVSWEKWCEEALDLAGIKLEWSPKKDKKTSKKRS